MANHCRAGEGTAKRVLEWKKNCPACGAPLATLDLTLAECDPRHQCHICWNVIGPRATERLGRTKAHVEGISCRRPPSRQAA